MKTFPPRALDPRELERMAGLLHAGANRDDVIGQMRSLGWNKIACIRTLRGHAGMSLREAKDIVHLSPAWADRYESDEALHDTLQQAAALISEEERTAA